MDAHYDPSRCPQCGGALAPRPVCPSCGLRLDSPLVATLGVTLREADGLLAQIRANRALFLPLPADTGRRPVEPSLVYAAPQPHRTFQPHERQPRQPRQQRRAGASVGTILLAVGGLCLVIAGGVFTAWAWTLLGWGGRAGIMVAVVVALLALAALSARRGLRASTETLAIVSAGFWWAAESSVQQGLSSRLSGAVTDLGAALLTLVAVGAGATWLARRPGRPQLPVVEPRSTGVKARPPAGSWALDVHAAVALAVASSALLHLPGLPDPATWSLLAAVGVLGLALRRRRGVGPGVLTQVVALGAGLGGYLALVWRGLVPAHRWVGDAVLVDGSVAPLDLGTQLTDRWTLVLAALALAGVAAVSRRRSVRVGALALAGAHLSGWVVLSAVLADVPRLSLLAAAGAVALTTAAGWWWRERGVQPTTGAVLGLAIPAVLVALRPATALLVAASHRLVEAGHGSWTPPVPARLTDLLAVALVVVGLATQPLVARLRRAAPVDPALALVVVLGVVCLAHVRSGAATLALLAGLGLALLVARRVLTPAGLPGRTRTAAAAALVLAPVLALTGLPDGLRPASFAVLAVALVVVALDERRPELRGGALALAGVCTLALLESGLVLAGLTDHQRGALLVGISAVLLGASAGARPDQGHTTGAPDALDRLALEVSALLGAVTAWVLLSSDLSLLALGLTFTGVGLAVARARCGDRPLYGWGSGVLLTVATWLRLVDADLHTLELYTVPAAVALLVWGARRLRREAAAVSDTGVGRSRVELPWGGPSRVDGAGGTRGTGTVVGSTWTTLMPGLALGYAPSLAAALHDPTSGRALVVGLVGLGLVLVGLRLRLAAPFSVGAVGTAALALAEVTPYVTVVPQWLLLSAAGVMLVGLGITWEQRLGDLRRAHGFVGRMR